MNKIFLLPICLLFVSCGSAGQQRECAERSENIAWASIDGRNLESELQQFFGSDKSRRASVRIFGYPATRKMNDDQLSWIRGMRRSERTYICGEMLEETFHVVYAVVELSFSKGGLDSCEIEFRNYIGKNEFPDVNTGDLIEINRQGCASYLDSQ